MWTPRPEAELWLDGGHNPDAGRALSGHLSTLPQRPTYMICGMLNTKDAGGYLGAFAGLLRGLRAVGIPGEPNTLPASETAARATRAGLVAQPAADVASALAEIVQAEPSARILIGGSLYLAGQVLRDNG